MPGNAPPKPTDAELGILRVLWEQGPSTVREVMDSLNEVEETGYTTVLKLLQIMTDKRLVTRREQGRLHIYQPARSEAETQRQLVRHLLDRAFGGSTHRLVLQALSTSRASAGELAEIRQLLKQMESKSK